MTCPRPQNERAHSDQDLKERMLELRGRGQTYKQIASILNEEGYIPLKNRKFTEANVRKLIKYCDETRLLTPKKYLENILAQMELAHQREKLSEPFCRPGLPKLAQLLEEAGYVTPRGRAHWWPAQVQQLLEGRFDLYYSKEHSGSERMR